MTELPNPSTFGIPVNVGVTIDDKSIIKLVGGIIAAIAFYFIIKKLF